MLSNYITAQLCVLESTFLHPSTSQQLDGQDLQLHTSKENWKIPFTKIRLCVKDTQILSVQFSRSAVSDSLQPHGLQHARPPCPSPKLMSIDSVMPFNHLILCLPVLLPSSIFPSIRVFSNESALCVRWPKYWSFSFNISPSNEYPGPISFRVDWLDSRVITYYQYFSAQH